MEVFPFAVIFARRGPAAAGAGDGFILGIASVFVAPQALHVYVKSGEPVTYYIGAAWDGDSRFEPIEWKWSQYMNGVSWNILQELYK